MTIRHERRDDLPPEVVLLLERSLLPVIQRMLTDELVVFGSAQSYLPAVSDDEMSGLIDAV